MVKNENSGTNQNNPSAEAQVIFTQLPGSLEQLIIASKVNFLEKEVKEIRSSSKYSLKNLRSEKLKLTEPLELTIEHNNGEVVITSIDLDLYGVGDSDEEALLDLSENIEEFYFKLQSEKDRLSRPLKMIWQFMESALTQINAA